MSSRLTEIDVEDATFAGLSGLGYAILHRPDIYWISRAKFDDEAECVAADKGDGSKAAS